VVCPRLTPSHKHVVVAPASTSRRCRMDVYNTLAAHEHRTRLHRAINVAQSRRIVSNATGLYHAWTRNLFSTKRSPWHCARIIYAIITASLVVQCTRGANRRELCNAMLDVRGGITAFSCFLILLFYIKKHFQS
jgi:hypothetical protein